MQYFVIQIASSFLTVFRMPQVAMYMALSLLCLKLLLYFGVIFQGYISSLGVSKKGGLWSSINLRLSPTLSLEYVTLTSFQAFLYSSVK